MADLQTFLPRFALVKAANTHDSTEGPELCADVDLFDTID